MVGRTLGHYSILQLLGKGGMGEVYLGEDLRLGRRVALKVLDPRMAQSAERLARFEREVKAVAALNHPNIVTLHSVEEADGVRFVTMEFVAGKTLRRLIPRGGMRLRYILEIAGPLAEAVAAAHQQGIVHRDLKPDNVMVGDDGRVKVLDFGLASWSEALAPEAVSGTPTITEHLTDPGTVVGTVPYMSPEQAEGKSVDRRSDIFSLGITLYEMATGRHPFPGTTRMSVISAIIHDTPTSVTELVPSLPRDLGKIVRRCLAKEPDRRYQTAIDLGNDLAELKQEVTSGMSIPSRPPAAPPPRLTRRSLLALAVLAGTLAVAAAALLRGLSPPASPPDQRGLPVASVMALTTEAGVHRDPSLAPDGKMVVYSGNATGRFHIYLLRVGGAKAIDLTPDSTANDVEPAFSPDGKRIAFRSERQGGGIFVMGATGESVRRVTDFGSNPAWSPDGTEIACGTDIWNAPASRITVSQLWRVKVATGERRQVYAGDAVQPSWSPHGRRIAFWAAEQGRRDIWTVAADGGKPVAVTSDDAMDWSPVWSPDGKSLYFASDRGGTMGIWRIAIDEATGKVLGLPAPLTVGGSGLRGQISLSADGRRLAYMEGTRRTTIEKIGFDPDHETTVGPPVVVTQASSLFGSPGLSPDGQWLAFDWVDGQEDICVCRTDGSERRQLTDDADKDRGPSWSPDGRRIAFYSNRGGSWQIWSVNADGSGLRQLTRAPFPLFHPVWSPDGRRLAAMSIQKNASYIVELAKDEADPPLTELPPLPDSASYFEPYSWSGDGAMLAGAPHVGSGVYVLSLESRTYRRASERGDTVAWLSDDRRLVYGHEQEFHLVDRQTQESHEILSLAPDFSGGFMLSRDDRWIYVTRISDDSQLWLLGLK